MSDRYQGASEGDPAAIAAEAGAPPPRSQRWDAWAPWLIIFGPVASGLGWIAGVLILWTSPTWSRRDQLIATFVPLAGFKKQWRVFRDAVDEILSEGSQK